MGKSTFFFGDAAVKTKKLKKKKFLGLPGTG